MKRKRAGAPTSKELETPARRKYSPQRFPPVAQGKPKPKRKGRGGGER
jgi:hypothetical protein